MNRRHLLAAAAALLGAISLTCPAFSEIFLAIGLPEGNPSKGWVAGWASMEDEALKLCRGLEKATNSDDLTKDLKSLDGLSTAQKDCKIVGDLRNQCFAIATNGTSTSSASAFGLNIAAEGEDAKAGAMTKCNAMRSGNASACILRNFRCDK